MARADGAADGPQPATSEPTPLATGHRKRCDTRAAQT